MTLDLMGKLRFLRRRPDWLLTLLTAVLALMIFVSRAPGSGHFPVPDVRDRRVAGDHHGVLGHLRQPDALWLMVIAFVANFTVSSCASIPWPYNLTLLAPPG